MNFFGSNELTQLQKSASKFSFIMLALVVFSSVAVDQVTKNQSEKTLKIWSHPTDLKQYRGELYPIWSNGLDSVAPRVGQEFFIAINLSYVRNQGAAWGVMADVDDSIRVPFFHIVTFLAIIVILLYMRNTPPSHRFVRYALALILSGAIGNSMNRVFLGYVIDWIDIRWLIWGWRYNFPNFNFADIAISFGVVLLIFDMLFLEAKRKSKAEEENTSIAS